MARYSNLSDLPIPEQYKLIFSMANFFSPLNNKTFHEKLGLPFDLSEPIKLRPLSLWDFFMYYQMEYEIDLFKNQYNIQKLVDKLVLKLYLTDEGSKKYTGGLGKCYYFRKEFSEKQRIGDLWVTEILGFNYLIERTKDLVIQITGINIDGDPHCGSGLLFNESTIITCAHVIKDMELDVEQYIQGKKSRVIFQKTHDKIDVGVIKLDNKFKLTDGLSFAEYNILDEILILGFPKIPLSRQAELICQKGEINGAIEDFDGNKYFLYSTFTKPGNSGGPIFNSLGNIVGIVSREIFNKDVEYNQVPFCLGIPLMEIEKAVNSIDGSISLPIEDFQ